MLRGPAELLSHGLRVGLIQRRSDVSVIRGDSAEGLGRAGWARMAGLTLREERGPPGRRVKWKR